MKAEQTMHKALIILLSLLWLAPVAPGFSFLQDEKEKPVDEAKPEEKPEEKKAEEEEAEEDETDEK